ncbi:hypothetical protein ACFQY5_00945 [Paeniroseomonas aquatica]|uniref:hypothetical protein n=1 Tax=Paeniroseomonas aquatica TaxID=373043 RepID=UPI0036166E2A
MRDWIRRAAGLALALGLAAPAAAQTRWVMATPYAENFHTLNIRQFIAEVEQATEGRLAIQLHANASLLPMAQIKRGCRPARCSWARCCSRPMPTRIPSSRWTASPSSPGPGRRRRR